MFWDTPVSYRFMAPINSSRLLALQKPFLLSCIHDGIRTDERELLEARPVKFKFSFTNRGRAEVCLGGTKVSCSVSGEVIRPRPDQPAEGQVTFNVDLSPMANSEFDIRPTTGTPTHERSAELSLMIESLLKKSRAVDTEALCVEGGAKVWSLNVDIQVLDDDGNIKDAAALAALAGLLHFRRNKELEYRGTRNNGERVPPSPLCIHHKPVLVTFCLVDDEGTLVHDPSRQEEAISMGHISIAVNEFKELCGIRKAGGSAVSSETLRAAIHFAQSRAVEVITELMKSLKEHDTARAIRRENLRNKYQDSECISVQCPANATDQVIGMDDIEPKAVAPYRNINVDVVQSKVKRKRKALLKKARREKMLQNESRKQLAGHCNDNSSGSNSPVRSPQQQQRKQSVATKEVINLADAELNEFDNENESNDLFSRAVIKKKSKKK